MSPARDFLQVIEHEIAGMPAERAVAIEHAAALIRKVVVEAGHQNGLAALCLVGSRCDVAIEEGESL